MIPPLQDTSLADAEVTLTQATSPPISIAAWQCAHGFFAPDANYTYGAAWNRLVRSNADAIAAAAEQQTHGVKRNIDTIAPDVEASEHSV